MATLSSYISIIFLLATTLVFPKQQANRRFVHLNFDYMSRWWQYIQTYLQNSSNWEHQGTTFAKRRLSIIYVIWERPGRHKQKYRNDYGVSCLAEHRHLMTSQITLRCWRANGQQM
jgi:hypothetical protein